MDERIRVLVIQPNTNVTIEKANLLRALETSNQIEVCGVSNDYGHGEVLADIEEPHIIVIILGQDYSETESLIGMFRLNHKARIVVVGYTVHDYSVSTRLKRAGAYQTSGWDVGEVQSAIAFSNEARLAEADFDIDAIVYYTESDTFDDVPENRRDKVQIFVSYSRQDWSDYVEELVAFLEESGFNIWVDQHLLRGGDVWLRKIDQALAESSYLILCLSPGALESRWVRKEYGYFLTEDKPIVPVICRPVHRLPFELRDIQYHLYDLRQLADLLDDLINRDELDTKDW